MILNPQQTYVHLSEEGVAGQIPGATFWQSSEADLECYDSGWLITEFESTEDWPTWEMHPNGDEFVYLLSGAVEVQLDQGGVVATIALAGSGAIVVPRGVWHTAKVRAPSRMLHVTRGAGTQTRPVQ